MDRRIKSGGDEIRECRAATRAQPRRENEIPFFPLPASGEKEREKNNEERTMPTWRKKPPNDHHFNKRSTAQQRAALADAAQLATARLYADVLAFWALCSRTKCRRHRRCAGEVTACLRRNMPTVAEHNHEAARSWVMVGGRTRIPPANHVEYAMRRTPATMWFG
jgi:hypothetical protein